MNDIRDHGDDAFARDLADKLRDPMAASPGFEQRVMAQVRAAAAESASRSWWSRGLTIRLTPLIGLAAAAGLAAAVWLGAPVGRGAVAGADTVYVVRFALADLDADSVAVVGAFNQWQRTATPLHHTGDGHWVAQVPVQRGRHEYAFVVRTRGEEHWIADPSATRVLDSYGTETSVISVGDAGIR